MYNYQVINQNNNWLLAKCQNNNNITEYISYLDLITSEQEDLTEAEVCNALDPMQPEHTHTVTGRNILMMPTPLQIKLLPIETLFLAYTIQVWCIIYLFSNYIQLEVIVEWQIYHKAKCFIVFYT